MKLLTNMKVNCFMLWYGKVLIMSLLRSFFNSLVHIFFKTQFVVYHHAKKFHTITNIYLNTI